MFQQVIENAKVFIEGCKDNSVTLKALDDEIEACQKVREGMLKARRKTDGKLSPQVELILKIEKEREEIEKQGGFH